MTKHYLLFTLLVLTLSVVSSQDAPQSEECGQEPSRDAQIIVEQLLSLMSEKRDFELISCSNFYNAEAALEVFDENGTKIPAQAVSGSEVVNGQAIKYLKYDEKWLEQLKSDDLESFNWVAVGVFAHELGHLILGHANERKGKLTKAQKHKLELEADKYMGGVLARMGAFPDEALSAYAFVNEEDDVETESHPKPSLRQDYVRAGYDLVRNSDQIDEVLKNELISKFTPDNKISSSVPVFMRFFDALGSSVDLNDVYKMSVKEQVRERRRVWDESQPVENFEYSYRIYGPSIYQAQWSNPQTSSTETYSIINEGIYYKFDEREWENGTPSNGSNQGDTDDEFIREIAPVSMILFDQFEFQTSSELTVYQGRKRFKLTDFAGESIQNDCWVVELPEELVTIGNAPYNGKLIRITKEQYFDINTGLLVGIIENQKITSYKNKGRKRENTSLVKKIYITDYQEDPFSCVQFPCRYYVVSVETVDGFELPETKILQIRDIEELNTFPDINIERLFNQLPKEEMIVKKSKS